MTTLSGTLNIGRTALLAHQQAVSVTGNNIANANTEGYSRQRVLLETAPTIQTPAGIMGTGVTADDVQRVVDRFIEPQIQGAIQHAADWGAQKEVMQRVEIVFNEAEGYGLNEALGAFFNAWQDLSNNPAGYSERKVLVAKAETLAATFNQMSGDLERIQADIDASLDGAVADINAIADQIAALNEEIGLLHSAGLTPNDQLDQRDRLLRDLSDLIDFTAATGADGRVSVTLGDGNTLVGAAPYGRLATVADAVTGHRDPVWDSAPGVDLNNDIHGGKLSGWLTARDTVLQGYLGDLDALVSGAGEGLMDRVNALHQTGFDLNADTGKPFFTGSGAGDLAVNPDIVADVGLVAAAAEAAGVPGGNGQALAIAALQHTGSMNGGAATFDAFYNAMVNDVGIRANTAGENHQRQDAMAQQLLNYRESVSGVSLDEEMVNLVKFQHAYDAAAKLIANVDEMLATVINMV